VQRKPGLDTDVTIPLKHVQVELVLSRRKNIAPSTWRHDLQSPFWRLYVHNRAGASIVYGRKRLGFKPNCIYLVPAWIRYLTQTNCSLVQDYIHFYVTGVRPTILRQFFNHPLYLPTDPLLMKLCERWQESLSRDPTLADLCWAGALVEAAVGIAFTDFPYSAPDACLNTKWESSQLQPAFECISRRLSDPPTNSELAKLCQMSTDHFARQFRLIVGVTPTQYGLERRISAAAQWLTSGTASLEEIAANTGFTDRFHFSRIFKARMAVPPAAYRKSHRITVGEMQRVLGGSNLKKS
jgi:AraC-like DNA-binding protein